MRKAGVILGHFYGFGGFSSRQKKRMNCGIDLLREGKVDYLVTTGGKGRLFNYSPISLGQLSANYLKERGVSEKKILIENKSVNTLQNAQFVLKILKDKGIKSLVVITSVDHLPKTKLIFRDIFPKEYKVEFVISDYFSGLWSIWDFFWHIAGLVKYQRK